MARNYRWAVIAGVATLGLAVARPAAGYLSDLTGHWAAPLIGALEARGIVSGDEEGRFNPEAALTRAQLAKLLVTSLGTEDDARLLAGYPSRFTDVPRWHWGRGYIESLAETGAVEGYGDDSFGPEDTVTRAQMAAILVRAAGLSEQARQMRFEQTPYTDDKAIPDWARGATHVARVTGLMNGFEDGSFRPDQPVTRAEGSVALFRLLSMRGSTFNLTGTVLRFDPNTRQGTLRNDLGGDVTFTMAQDARYFRNGAAATQFQIRPLDQVWILKDLDGAYRYLDARYDDLLAANMAVDGQSIAATPVGGERKRFTVQPGALVYLNGQPVTLAQATGANQAYLVLDRVTGEVRAVDAVMAPLGGRVNGYDSGKKLLYVRFDTQPKGFPFAPDAVLWLNGQRVQPGDLKVNDRVQFAVNEAGAVTYLLTER